MLFLIHSPLCFLSAAKKTLVGILTCELSNSFRDVLELLIIRVDIWAFFFWYNKPRGSYCPCCTSMKLGGVKPHIPVSRASTLQPGSPGWGAALLSSPPAPGEGSTGSPAGSHPRVLQGPLIPPSPFQTATNSVVCLDQGTLVGLAGFHTHSLSFKSAREIPVVLKTHIRFFFPFLSFFFFLSLVCKSLPASFFHFPFCFRLYLAPLL